MYKTKLRKRSVRRFSRNEKDTAVYRRPNEQKYDSESNDTKEVSSKDNRLMDQSQDYTIGNELIQQDSNLFEKFENTCSRDAEAGQNQTDSDLRNLLVEVKTEITGSNKIARSNHKKIEKDFVLETANHMIDKNNDDVSHVNVSSTVECIKQETDHGDKDDDKSEGFMPEVKIEVFNEDEEISQDTQASDSDPEIIDHMIDTKDINCMRCEVWFSGRKDYVAHVRDIHEKLVLCDHCDDLFETRKAMRKHLFESHKSLSYKCTVGKCDREFKRKSYLTKHINTFHLNIRKYQCEFCGFRSKSSSNLKTHTSRCSGDKTQITMRTDLKPFNFKCTFEGCFKQFKENCILTKHINAVHLNIRKHLCEFCGFCFKTLGSLSNHIAAYHIKQKRDEGKCDVCHKFFKRLKSHKQLHLGTKGFRCSFKNCNKSFSMKSGLTKHEMIHKDIYLYQCETCKERFRRKSYLETHMYKHTGVKIFRCFMCSKTFSQKGNLKVHQLLHDKDRPEFKCDKCSYTSNFKSNFTKHMQQHVKLEDGNSS